MSAIFGILRFDGGEVSARALERMGNTLAHRAPDGRRTMVDGPVGLGHGLMRVNREDSFEVQPLEDREADLALVADLRLDNREALAAAFGIGADALRDMPDSALLMRAYKRWGESFPEHLLGDFAFAIWDGGARKLVLGRDHMGQRYLHYHHGRDFIAFATEMKALWAVADVPRRISEISIGKQLIEDTKRTPGATLYDEVFGLPGGTTLSVTPDGTAAQRTYWEPRADPAHVGHSEDYHVERYQAILGEAVRCRVSRLTRPPALCFSGGFDSGGIAALAGPIVVGQKRNLIAAASVMPEDHPGPARDARPAVEACRRHMPFLDVRYYARGEETLLGDLEQSFIVTDGAGGNNYVFRGLHGIAAAAGARLVMDGHGGDYTLNYRGVGPWGPWLRSGRLDRIVRELFCLLRMPARRRWPALRREIVHGMLPAGAVEAWRSMRRGFAPILSTRPITAELARRLITEGRADPARLRGRASASGRGRAWRVSVLNAQRATTRPGLSVLAAAHGLDLSRPFHDKRVVEFALAIPEELHFRNGRSRYLARRALAGLLPEEILAHSGPNDSQDPDFLRMSRSMASFAIDEADRLSRNPRIARMVDFTKVQQSIAAAVAPDDAVSHLPQPTALKALVIARFVEWLEGSNAASDRDR